MRFQKVVDNIAPQNCHRFNAYIVLPSIKGKRVLDIGCWNGNFLSLIEDFCWSVGMDISEESLKVAQTGLSTSKLINATALNLPFQDKCFDLVTMWDVIEHIPEGMEGRVLLEINRVLNRKGKISLSTINNHIIGKLLDPAYFFCDHRHYRERRIIELLKHFSFTIDRIYYSTGIFSFLWGNINLFYKHVLHRRVPKLGFYERLKEREFTLTKNAKRLLFRIHIIATKENSVF